MTSAVDVGAPLCRGCDGPHPFDTSVPSPLWNTVIRDGGLPDYLCVSCIVAAFARARLGFTATLYGDDFTALLSVEPDLTP